MPAVVLLVLLAASPPPPAPGDERLAARSQAAKQMMAAGRYAEAATAYRELVRAMPGNAGLLVNLGMALHMAGRDADAIAPLQSALRIDPESVPGNLFLGAARLGTGHPDTAITPLQKAVRLQPDNVDARSMLAESLVATDRRAEAEPHLRRLTELAPTEPATWFNLGQAYEDLAGEVFGRLAEHDPESAYALALAADARVRHGDRTAAFHLYRDALARAPSMRGLHGALAEIYRGARHPDWAAVEEEKERRLPRPDCARETPECLFTAGKYGELVARFSGAPASATAPSGSAAAGAPVRTADQSYWLARAYDGLAARAFDRLAGLPPSVYSYERAARVSRDERRYRESAELWRKAVAKQPEDPRLQAELAITLRMDQDLDGARRVLESLLRKDPESPEPNYLLGDVLLTQQEPDRAVGLLEKAVRLDPEEPHAQGALGRAYALLGRPADAIPHLERAIEVDDDGSLRLQLARAYEAAGKTAQAQAARKDYEEFRKAAHEEDRGGMLTPPESVPTPPRR